MALLEWNDTLSVKINEIDLQHKKLVELINNLNDAMKIGKSKEVIGDIILNLSKYTVAHFSTEERYMDKFKYVDAKNHKIEHKKFVDKVSEFQKSYNEGKSVLSIEIMNFLKDWLVTHIKGTDKKYSSFFIEKGLK